MSLASASNSLYIANHNGNHEKHPTFYSQSYLSPNYDSVCIQHLRNMILNESEIFYNQKIEELKNQTICEAAVYGNNKTTYEKQSVKELLLL